MLALYLLCGAAFGTRMIHEWTARDIALSLALGAVLWMSILAAGAVIRALIWLGAVRFRWFRRFLAWLCLKAVCPDCGRPMEPCAKEEWDDDGAGP